MARVLLIDCDLRKARVHRYLEIEHGRGISNVLCGFCEMGEVIQKDVRKNLDVITANDMARMGMEIEQMPPVRRQRAEVQFPKQ